MTSELEASSTAVRKAGLRFRVLGLIGFRDSMIQAALPLSEE